MNEPTAAEYAASIARACNTALELQKLCRDTLHGFDFQKLRPDERDASTRHLVALVAAWGHRADLANMPDDEATKQTEMILSDVHRVLTTLYVLGYKDGLHEGAARALMAER